MMSIFLKQSCQTLRSDPCFEANRTTATIAFNDLYHAHTTLAMLVVADAMEAALLRCGEGTAGSDGLSPEVCFVIYVVFVCLIDCCIL
jgi:hypothetical protein